MITAQGIRDKQNKCVVDHILDEIEEDISKAIETGEFYVKYTFRSLEPQNIRDDVVAALEELKFSVSYDRHKLSLIIHWNNEGGKLK